MKTGDEIKGTSEKYWVDHLLRRYGTKPGDEVKYTTITANGRYEGTAIVTFDHGEIVEARTPDGEKLRLERAYNGALRRIHLKHVRLAQALMLVVYGHDEAPHPIAPSLTREEITDDDERAVRRLISEHAAAELSAREECLLDIGGEG